MIRQIFLQSIPVFSQNRENMPYMRTGISYFRKAKLLIMDPAKIFFCHLCSIGISLFQMIETYLKECCLQFIHAAINTVYFIDILFCAAIVAHLL